MVEYIKIFLKYIANQSFGMSLLMTIMALEVLFCVGILLYASYNFPLIPLIGGVVVGATFLFRYIGSRL